MSEGAQEDLETYRKNVGGRVLRVTCRPALKGPALELLDTFVRLGPARKTIFFGGAPFRLAEIDGQFEVQQPDYMADAPMETWTSDVTDTLLMLFLQMQTAQRAGAAPEEYRLDQTVLVLKSAVGDEKVYMERRAPSSQDDSGWFLGSAERGPKVDHQPSDYGIAPLYALFQLRHAALQALALPTGYLAVFEGDNLVGISNDRNEEVYKPPS